MTEEKPKPLRAVRPNVGLRFRYQRQMLALIEEMNASILYWIEAQYKKAPPALALDALPSIPLTRGITEQTVNKIYWRMAMDANPLPSRVMQKKFREIAKQWLKRFDAAAPKIADAYLKGSFKATDSAMRAALKDSGFAVKFKMSAAMKDAFNASLNENVGLIKSIPSHYLTQVEGIVSRNYAAGRDLATMVKELTALYPKAQRRAVLIARDQSNKANSIVENARRLELGITQAVWMHSGGGKHPRKYHVKADGKIYDVRKGCPIRSESTGDIEFIMPGQKINCRCVSRSVIPGLTRA